MAYTQFTPGTIAKSSEVNNNFGNTIKSIIINKMNTTEDFVDDRLKVERFDTDSASSNTNWTYNATDDRYENQQTSAAVLTWTGLLTNREKAGLSTEQNAVLYAFYEPTGDETSGVVLNPSFETAGAGGTDVFADWSESTGLGTFSQSTSNVTDGTFSAEYFYATGSPVTATGTLTQNINVDDISFVTIDAFCSANAQGGSQQCVATLNVGGVTDSIQVNDGNNNGVPVTTTGTAVVDVREIVGNVNIVLTFALNHTAGGGGHTGIIRMDNIRLWSTATTANQTVTFEVSPDGGTTWDAVTLTEPKTLTNPITDLQVRISETNTEGSAEIYSRLLGWGVWFG